ncbi:MAG: tRNA (adenine-N1)-methyltransferase [Acidimicrobiales bacterium]
MTGGPSGDPGGPSADLNGRRALAAGERVLLVDSKDRRRLVRLVPGGRYHSHAGVLEHDCLIGRPEGSSAKSDRGARFVAVRPTLADVVIAMPRGAQVVYPKDLGAILMAADVFPGARVLEAGVGSGALSMALLRAGADVLGYEVRDDFAAAARENVSSFLGETGRYSVISSDVYEGISQRGLDRVVLDLPEPWRVVGHAAAAMRPGGILVSYLPSISQVSELRSTLGRSDFGMEESFEVLQRGWHVAGRAVRPDHRMVAHTGFLTVARLLSPDPDPRVVGEARNVTDVADETERPVEEG